MVNSVYVMQRNWYAHFARAKYVSQSNEALSFPHLLLGTAGQLAKEGFNTNFPHVWDINLTVGKYFSLPTAGSHEFQENVTLAIAYLFSL